MWSPATVLVPGSHRLQILMAVSCVTTIFMALSIVITFVGFLPANL